MLRILRYSPNATTNTVQSEHSQEINASQSGTDWFIGSSVAEPRREAAPRPLPVITPHSEGLDRPRIISVCLICGSVYLTGVDTFGCPGPEV
jgi:hypothetical protein